MTAPAFPASLYAPIPPNLGLPVKGKPVTDGGGCGCGCCCDSGGPSLTGGKGGCTAETSPIQTGGPGGGQTSPGGLKTVQPCYTADGTGDALDAASKVLMTNCKQTPPLGVPLGGGG